MGSEEQVRRLVGRSHGAGRRERMPLTVGQVGVAGPPQMLAVILADYISAQV